MMHEIEDSLSEAMGDVAARVEHVIVDDINGRRIKWLVRAAWTALVVGCAGAFTVGGWAVAQEEHDAAQDAELAHVRAAVVTNQEAIHILLRSDTAQAVGSVELVRRLDKLEAQNENIRRLILDLHREP